MESAMAIPRQKHSMIQSAWHWAADSESWFQEMARRVSNWKGTQLRLSHEELFRSLLLRAAINKSPWLAHPCMSPLVNPKFGNHDAEARMAFWIAINSEVGLDALGSVDFDHPVDIFGQSGSFLASAGTHFFVDIGQSMPKGLAGPIPDPWGTALPERTAIGDLAVTSWWEHQPLTQRQELECNDNIVSLMRANHALRSTLPAAYAWYSGMTQVIVPLSAGGSGQFRSGSVSEIPGLVVVEITASYLLTLEALIHETAHLYFHFKELANPLIGTDGLKLYTSPLRVDPRPIRGIFLAYHALIYMCAFYEDWFAATTDRRCLEALDNLRPLRRDAGTTMASAEASLTDAGIDFLRICDALAGRDDAAIAQI
jgi:hypothetical protein